MLYLKKMGVIDKIRKTQREEMFSKAELELTFTLISSEDQEVLLIDLQTRNKLKNYKKVMMFPYILAIIYILIGNLNKMIGFKKEDESGIRIADPQCWIRPLYQLWSVTRKFAQ